MPAPSLCTITGTLRKANGAVWPNGQLTISRAASTSQVLGGTSVIITADASGAVSFDLVQGSIVTISGAFVIGKDAGVDYDFSRGLRIFVPVQSSATLEALKTIEDELAAISAPTTDAIEVQEAGVSLGSFTALNFATGATVTDAGGGVADVDITGGGGGGSVSSVFGRTGAVVAATNDYTFAQINKTTSSLADLTTRSASDLSSGTLPDARFPATLPALSGANLTALNASNLASGTVPLARLSGITNTEIDAAAAIAYSKLNLTGAILNADLAGSIANAKLANSSVTIGSTSVSLGGTAATVAGLTLTTPTIASFTNATHDHSNAAGGGQIAISAGISGLGTGIATALGVNVGSAGAPVLFNGAGGTPSAITLTNATGLPPTTGIVGWPANAVGVLTNDGAGALSWGAGTSGANPTAVVGLAAVNGVATTFLRSDGAPALDQGIVPTWTARHIWSVNGAVSAPGLTATGTWFTGGSATTTKPYVLIETTGATSTGWSTSGTGLGVNAASGFTGNIADFQVNGTSKVKVTSTGAMTIGGAITNTGTFDLIPSTASFTVRVGTNGFYPTTNNTVDLGFASGSFSWKSLQLVGRIGWDNAGTVDTGLGRAAAGHVRVTNASTGAGSFIIGTSTVGSVGTSGVGVLAVANGTAPSSSPADEFQLYSADWNGAGTAAAHFRNEEGHIIKLARAATYTPTNVTTDRSYDANATTLDEVADVLGTLIADLQTLGFLG